MYPEAEDCRKIGTWLLRNVVGGGGRGKPDRPGALTRKTSADALRSGRSPAREDQFQRPQLETSIPFPSTMHHPRGWPNFYFQISCVSAPACSASVLGLSHLRQTMCFASLRLSSFAPQLPVGHAFADSLFHPMPTPTLSAYLTALNHTSLTSSRPRYGGAWQSDP